MPVAPPRFADEMALFLQACPGPPAAKVGLTRVAFQKVRGIRGLSRCQQPPTGPGPVPLSHDTVPLGEEAEEETVRYLRSVAEVAKSLHCRPAYLSRSALTHGYSYSRALRWIRFLHAMALQAEGFQTETLVRRLGFGDAGGWSRFTSRLVGRSPRQLPTLPLSLWVRKAVDDVFLGVPASGAIPRVAVANNGRGRKDKKKGENDMAGKVASR